MTELVRTLRLRDLLLLFIGSVIGSGIFRTPGPILRQVDGSVGLSLLVWLVGGVLSLLGALTYAELAAANPEAGGLYCYIRDGFGRLSAFLYGWCLFLVIASGSVAALARVFSEYLATVLPISPLGQTIIAVVMIAIGHHGREILSALGPAQHGPGIWSDFGLAMIAVLWAYEGWQFGTYSAGEVIDPQKAFPRAFLLGSLILVGLYFLAIIAYLFALGPKDMAASNTLAATSVATVFGPWAGKIVALTILISTFSAANSVILTAPRVFYAMANDKLFFRKLAEVHPRFKTPAAAIVGLGVWSAILVCAGELGSFSSLIGGVIFIGWIFYGLGAAAIFPIRRASAGRPIPYRVPGYPWTPILFVLVAAAIVANAIYLAFLDPSQFKNLAAAILLFLIGLPAYFFWRKGAT